MRFFKRLLSLSLALLLLVPLTAVAVLSAAPEGAGAVVLKGGKRDMAWPVPSASALSSCFLDPMAERDHVHYAIDIAAVRESAIVPVYDGTVYLVMDNNSAGNGGYGNGVIVKHTYTLATGETVTLYSRYSHMNSIAVTQGQKVKKGVTRLGGVGGSGATENTYADHLDFQLIYTSTGTLTLSEMTNRRVTSIDPFINQLVEIPDRLNASGASSWCTCCQDYVQYVKALYAKPLTYGYLAQCQLWNAHASVRVVRKTAAYSQPCTEDVLETAECLETAVPESVYTATALYQNTVGEYWYRVSTMDGAEAYLPAADTALVELLYSDVSITDANWPTVQRQSKSFGIQGAVSSLYTKLVSVSARVHDDGQDIISATTQVNSRSYSLSGSSVDNNLSFGKLPLGGHTYQVDAVLRNHYLDDDGQTVQQQEQSVTLVKERFSVVTTLTCEHQFTMKTVAPTCTQPGYDAYVCQCGYTQYSDLEALGHDCPAWTAEVPATCMQDGLQVCDCQRCGQRQERVLPALGHDVQSRRTEQSCIGAPITRTNCTRCGQTWVTYDESSYSPWQSEMPDVEASLLRTQTEYRSRTLQLTTGTSQTMAGWTMYNAVTDWGQYGDWSDWTDTALTASDATQVETRQLYGYYYYLCQSCGAHMHTNHCYSWAGGCGKDITGAQQQVWLDLSWSDADMKNFYSTGVSYTQYEGQNLFKLSGTQPQTQYRSRTRELETTYHFQRWSDWTDWAETAPEATDELQVESRCLYSYVVTNGGSHSYAAAVTAPSCTQQGYTVYTCTVCGDTYRTEITECVPHAYGQWETVTPASCTAEGVQTRSCPDCGAAQQQTLPMLEHSFENGSCTVCGSSEFSPGDVNRDGRVNIMDVMCVINIITGSMTSTQEQQAAADLSGDGLVNIMDAMALINQITGL